METNRYQEQKIEFIDLDDISKEKDSTSTGAALSGAEKIATGSKEKRPASATIFLVLGIIFLCIFLVTGILLFRYYLNYRNQISANQDIIELRQMDLADKKEDSKQSENPSKTDENADIIESIDITKTELYKVNSDYVGFITIPDTDIYYPIVYKDNEYYLKHNFKNEKNSHGAIFLDENCNMDSDIILIHGHHMKDGTMFQPLKGYRKEEFRKNHMSIYIDRGAGDEEYAVFAVALIDLTKEDCFDYGQLPVNKLDKMVYLDTLKKNSLWKDEKVFGKDNDINSQIAILSTCEYGTASQRLIVAAIKK